MKKIILAILAVILTGAAAYLVYLNEAVLPEKIKTALIDGFERSTGGKITLSSAKLSPLGGLVIKDLAILDNDVEMISSREVVCGLSFIPIFKKQIAVTAIRFNSPRILVTRLPDNSTSLEKLLITKPISIFDGRLELVILRIVISKGEIDFRDSALTHPFEKKIKNADAHLKFALPAKAVFSTNFEIQSKVPMIVKASGEYNIIDKGFSAKIEARDFYPKDFAPYCQGLTLPDGLVDVSAHLNAKDGIFAADTDLSAMSLKFQQENINADLNCALKTKMKYNFADRAFTCTGRMEVRNLGLSNVEAIGAIHDIRGVVDFTEKDFSFSGVTATVAGIPVKAKAFMKDFSAPVLEIDMNASTDLALMERILKEKFGMNIPVDFRGASDLYLGLKYKMPAKELPLVDGRLDVKDAMLKTGYNPAPLEGMTGRVSFTRNQLAWSNLRFRFTGSDYVSSGVLTNFDKPGIQLKLDSNAMSIESLASINDKIITLSGLSGRYEDYGFSIAGVIDVSDPQDTKLDINGTLKFDLAEDKEPFKGLKEKFKDAKPSGNVTALFNLKGGAKDLANCPLDAEVKSDLLGLYGFSMNDLEMIFSKRNGIVDIKRLRSSLYGGTLEASGLIDLVSKDAPYQINADIKGMKIERIKKDTAFKDADISGTIQAHLGCKGFSNDLDRFGAWGKVNIFDGKLWQLNLFRGIGTLLFKSDFSSVLFKEGSCDFSFKNRSLFADNLVLKSDLLNLSGTVRTGADNSISAFLKAEFTYDGLDAANVSNLAGAIERYSIVEISGTLKDPKFKLKADLSNIARDLAENFFQR